LIEELQQEKEVKNKTEELNKELINEIEVWKERCN
jgi:hypothetical protein